MKSLFELNPGNSPTPDRRHCRRDGESEGARRRDRATTAIREHRQRQCAEVQARFLRRLLESPDCQGAADDIPDDIRAKYRKNGAHVGAAICGLAQAGFIRVIGRRKSARPSRHGCEIKVFEVVNRRNSAIKLAALEAFLRTDSQETNTAAPGATDATANDKGLRNDPEEKSI